VYVAPLEAALQAGVNRQTDSTQAEINNSND